MRPLNGGLTIGRSEITLGVDDGPDLTSARALGQAVAHGCPHGGGIHPLRTEEVGQMGSGGRGDSTRDAHRERRSMAEG